MNKYPWKSVKRCPKCEAPRKHCTVTYKSAMATVAKTIYFDEHMRLKCTHCEFSWLEQPAHREFVWREPPTDAEALR